MNNRAADIRAQWGRLIRAMLPFADAATTEFPLRRILRLSLFQISVGMATVLLTGTLNRVMITELGVPAWIVALMVAMPLVFAPLRALIGFKSDTHASVLGLRRLPYIWFGTLMQYGGLAIMPFSLLLLTHEASGTAVYGTITCAVAFLLVGAGLHTTQTAGLALATDLATDENRARVVPLLYVMLLVGMLLSAVSIGFLLIDFSHQRLIQVIQGAAVVSLVLNLVALWRQEARNPDLTDPEKERPVFAEAWKAFMDGGRPARLLIAVGLGAAAFAMQDILLEPYGGEVLGLSVGGTTLLTALWAAGALVGFGLAARSLTRGHDAHRLAGIGMVIGVFAFALVVLSDPLGSAWVFRIGSLLIGLGGGLFAVGTLTAVMELGEAGGAGIALGAWGAVQATAAGIAVALGGGLRDIVGAMADAGQLGQALQGPAVGYQAVYHIEIALLFAALVVIGPLARHAGNGPERTRGKFGLTEFPS